MAKLHYCLLCHVTPSRREAAVHLDLYPRIGKASQAAAHAKGEGRRGDFDLGKWVSSCDHLGWSLGCEKRRGRRYVGGELLQQVQGNTKGESYRLRFLGVKSAADAGEEKTTTAGKEMNHQLRKTMSIEREPDNESERWILVTGGAGYIGSHTTLQLLLERYKVVIVDNLDNSDEEAVKRVVELSNKNGVNLYFYKVDICKRDALERIFQKFRFDAVIHFAGLKAVGESVAKPLRYYSNNLVGTLNLLEIMSDFGCKKLVFSSSATVYGQPKSVPCTEEFPVETLNPYGRTKLYIEEMSRDLQKADPEWRIILLRYFNPVGAHPSGLIGEDPRGIPNNLMPFLQQVAVGRRPEFTVFGSDYNTRDGTGVRDYIHIQDLATGHSAALQKLFNSSNIGCTAYNLGTGRGTSVLEMVAAFEKACGKKLPVRIADRRPGDASELYAATEKAEKELGWTAKMGIEDMCRDQWNWASKNPWGYRPPQKTGTDSNQA